MGAIDLQEVSDDEVAKSSARESFNVDRDSKSKKKEKKTSCGLVTCIVILVLLTLLGAISAVVWAVLLADEEKIVDDQINVVVQDVVQEEPEEVPVEDTTDVVEPDEPSPVYLENIDQILADLYAQIGKVEFIELQEWPNEDEYIVMSSLDAIRVGHTSNILTAL